jgi:hypothetical protein
MLQPEKDRDRERQRSREREINREVEGRERRNFAALGVVVFFFVAEGKGSMDRSGFFYLGAPGGSLPSSPARWLFSPPSGARGPSR